MTFSINDAIVHPRHGAGHIVGIEHEELVEGFDNFYVIQIPAKSMTLRLPVGKAEDMGVRPAMTKTKLGTVLSALRGTADRLPGDHKARQAQIKENLRSGRPTLLAKTIRDLLGHEQRAHLTKTDKRLLDNAREKLAAEIALVTGRDAIDALKIIDAALAASQEQSLGVT